MLTQEQQKDLEQAILQYLKDKDYKQALESLQSESTLLQDTNLNSESEKLLERKWLTIIKLQSKIVDLEQKLRDAQHILSQSVRTFKKINIEDQNDEDEIIKKPTLKLNHIYKGHKDVINTVALHQTEPIFASGSGDSTIRIYDYELKEQIKILKGHTHSVNSVCWDKGTLVSGSSDMTLKIWRSSNKTNEFDFGEFYCVKTLIGHEHAVSYVHNIVDTNITVSCSRDKSMRFWDRSTSYCRRTINDFHEEWVRCCDSNSKYFVSSGNDKKVFVFALDSILNFDKSNSSINCVNCFEVHDNYVEALKIYKTKALDNVETICITASRDKTIGVWNYLQGTELINFVGHENWVKDLQIIESYDFLISVGEDKTIRVWDLKKKKQIFILKNAHDHFICSVDYHEKYKIVLTGSVDKKTKIWKLGNTTTDDLLNILQHANNDVTFKEVP